MLQRLENKLNSLKQNTYILYLVYKDKRIGFWRKAFLGLVIGYLFSPIDLIPDFIPIIGYLDDLIIVPIGIVIALKIIPKDIIEDAKERSRKEQDKKIPIGYKTAVLIVFIWLLGLIGVLYWVSRLLNLL